MRLPEAMSLTRPELPLLLGAAALALTLAVAGLAIHRARRSPNRRLLATVKAIAADYLHDIIIPDGVDGQIHLDFVLLTGEGILVLDVKDHHGSVFAGANMEQWTVMNGSRRISVRNPLGPLHDRVEAVRQLVEHEVPVEGRALFTGDAQFVKGRPDGVLLLDELRDNLGQHGAGDERAVEAFRTRWQRLREIAART
jgi:hypothetical protein